ncbi:MAG TPA: CpaD family pilus assembly protein [Allosphingosinicella sp.]|jgi:pilus assembly protein CpaD
MFAIGPKESFNMVSKASLPALLALAASVSACSGTTGGTARIEPNRSLYSTNQPVVQRTDYVLDLSAPGGDLGPEERGRLLGWFQSLGLGYGDRIFVDGYARDQVARVAAEYGLLLSDGTPVTAGQVQPGSVRVIVSRSTAEVPSCPNWDNKAGPSSTSSNYGCATNSNLAAMVADPNDLVLGQVGDSAGDAATGSKAIRAYRNAAPTGASGLKVEGKGK